jgi:hypothetical protein
MPQQLLQLIAEGIECEMWHLSQRKGLQMDREIITKFV